MKKTTYRKIVNELIDSVNRLSISMLYQNVMNLDTDRYFIVLNLLSPSKFLEFVSFDAKAEEFSKIWQTRDFGHGIKKELLDALPPALLISIAGKCNASISGSWGGWYKPDRATGEPWNKKVCHNLSDYFLVSSPERVAEIIKFLVQSCKNVKAPASEKDRNIFLYNEKNNFPFEVIHLFFSVHPKIFFSALNLISKEQFKKIFWLCDKGVYDEGGMENIFQGEYDKNFSFEPEVFEIIALHITQLNDRYLMKFLARLREEAQSVVLPIIGKNRIVQIHSMGFDISMLHLPEDWKVFTDRQSNEGVLSLLKSGSKSITTLSPKKKIELLGSLA